MLAQMRLLIDILSAAQSAIPLMQAGDLQSTRSHIDRLRELRSLMADHVAFKDVSEWSKDASLVELALEAAHAANTAFDTIALLQRSLLLKKNLRDGERHPNEIIDGLFPLTWNWDRDLFIFTGEPTTEWLNTLNSRGQKRILFCSSHNHFAGFNSEDWIASTPEDDVDTLIQKWHPYFPRRYIEYRENSTATEKDDHHVEALLDAIMREQTKENTVASFSKRWVKQQYYNSHKAINSYGLSDLKAHVSGKNVIIVSPGPSLSRNIEKLKEVKDYFLVISVAQACPALLKHGIIPDMVAVIDPIDYSSVLDKFDCSQSSLIIDDRCAPAFLQKNFKNIFILSSGFSLCGTLDATGELPYSSQGGSVSVVSFDLCVQCNASSISLIGQDLSIEGGVYYDLPGCNTELSFSNNDKHVLIGAELHRLYSVPGYFGGEVPTKQDYWHFHYEFERIAATVSQDIQLFNATEGGAFIEGFEHIPLSHVMRKLNPYKVDVLLPKVEHFDIQKRKAKLLRFHQRQIKICNKIERLCENILTILSIGAQIESQINQLDRLELLIAAETKKLPLLSGMLQGELKYFESRLRQCKRISQNLELSRSLYETIKLAANEYSELILGCKEAFVDQGPILKFYV